MLDLLLKTLEITDDFLWGYIGVPAIFLFGVYFSFKSRFVQIRKFPHVVKYFFNLFKHKTEGEGIHPLKTFFASLGGCTGIGNIVAICTAAQIGGPGALLWVWVTAIVGTILKYSEIYIGIQHRVEHSEGGFRGGPMYYLRKVFKGSFFANLACILLCIYGVEIYQFGVVTTSISLNFGINKLLVILVVLGLVIGAVMGGIRRVGTICGQLLPLFILCYLGMGIWVFAHNLDILPAVMKQVFVSAFTGHAAVGGFAGSGMLIAVSQGMRRGCYAGDIGIGYASVMHSESCTVKPERQAMLAFVDIFLDSFLICTTSVLLVLVTGVWKEPLHSTLLVQTALSHYFPYMEYIMPIFLFMLGYKTIIAYFLAGLKCAEHLAPVRGKYYFYAFAITVLILFSFIDTTQALLVMSLTGVLLLFLNLTAIFKLRNEICFDLDK